MAVDCGAESSQAGGGGALDLLVESRVGRSKPASHDVKMQAGVSQVKEKKLGEDGLGWHADG